MRMKYWFHTWKIFKQKNEFNESEWFEPSFIQRKFKQIKCKYIDIFAEPEKKKWKEEEKVKD